MLDKYLKHGNFLLVGDLNAKLSEPYLLQFFHYYNVKTLKTHSQVLDNCWQLKAL